MEDATQTNRQAWNTWLVRDVASSHHQDVARFQRTGSSLRAIERAELGDVAGRSLLHLLCNMGSETLSWARLGASVTGVDLSDTAIAKAEELARESGLAARFIRADLYELPAHLDKRFDIVFMSYGALLWLADIPRWAALVARYLVPGGTCYLVDMHPFANMLAQSTAEPDGLTFRVHRPYSDSHPSTPPRGAPADPHGMQADGAPAREYRCWNYALGDVISALIAAGLRIEYLHEFPYQHYQQFPALVRDADGWWRWPTAANTMPLLFSLRATQLTRRRAPRCS